MLLWSKQRVLRCWKSGVVSSPGYRYSTRTGGHVPGCMLRCMHALNPAKVGASSAQLPRCGACSWLRP